MRLPVWVLLFAAAAVSTQSPAGSLVEPNLAHVGDVRVVLIFDGTVDPIPGVDPDAFRRKGADVVRLALRQGGIVVADSGSSVLVVSMMYEQSHQRRTCAYTAVSVQLQLMEILWIAWAPGEQPTRVEASTWQTGDVVLVENASFEGSVLESIGYLVEEFAGQVNQAREVLPQKVPQKVP